MKSLFGKGYMIKITLIMFLNWMTTTMCYYGLSLFSVNLTDDIYVNFVLFAVIEIPSYIFCVLVSFHFLHCALISEIKWVFLLQVMDGFGRKTVLVFCQILAGTTCIIAGFVPEDSEGAVVALTLAGRGTFPSIYIRT